MKHLYRVVGSRAGQVIVYGPCEVFEVRPSGRIICAVTGQTGGMKPGKLNQLNQVNGHYYEIVCKPERLAWAVGRMFLFTGASSFSRQANFHHPLWNMQRERAENRRRGADAKTGKTK